MLNSYLDQFLAFITFNVRQKGDTIGYSCPHLHQICACTLSCKSVIIITFLEISCHVLSPVHIGDYSRRIRRLSPKTATLAEFGDNC